MILLNQGSYRVEYEDTLRAIGNYLDVNGFRHVTIVETPEGFLTKGVTINVAPTATTLSPQTYLFTNEDIEAVIEEAYARRGRGPDALPPSHGNTLRLEHALRAIGRQIDDEKLYDIVLVQIADGFRVRALPRPDVATRESNGVVEHTLPDDAIRGLIENMRAGRASESVLRRKLRWPFTN